MPITKASENKNLDDKSSSQPQDLKITDPKHFACSLKLLTLHSCSYETSSNA
uniref:Uncharacterized protein n=1 Tax=Nelumbo nucifera TaxID=4432 RepID=A0A822Z051_NELNU|nr:TPA_asm: hypothetical protein HUJ06_007017 [Nelumbo nucifera]